MDPKVRGDLAKQVLDNQVFKEAIEAVKSAYVAKMIGTASDDRERRDKYYLAIHALSDIQQSLTLFVQNGKIDEAQTIKRQKTASKGELK